MAYDGSNTTQQRFGLPYMPYGSFADKPASAATGASIVTPVSMGVSAKVAINVAQNKEGSGA